MDEDKQTSKDSIGEVSQPKEENSFSYSNDNPNQKITTSLFNGTNYLYWSRSATLSLKGRGRLEYVNGKLVPPSMEDPDFDKWDRINSVVMNWLINSMIPEIGEELLGLTTAKEIWDTVANAYSKRGNIAQVYDFQQSMDHLQQGELSQLNTSTNTPSSFTHSGNFASSGNLATSVSAFSSHTQLPWIIDSGASDHMTGQPSAFSSYKPYSGHDKVKIADGTFSSVSGKGLVHATSSLPLSTVLHVPSFSTNLLSISRITRDLNCSVTFFPSHCVFQDLLTKQKIGSGSEKNGLYLLDLALNKQGQSSTAHHSTVPTKDGHPPLGWSETAAYLVLPVLLVVSQFVSMELMKPPQTDDPNQKNTLLVLKFLPLMIGYFSLSVPSGLSIYWFTNNVLSTAQQVWLRKLGGAKPVVSENASGIISAGRAKRSDSQPMRDGDRFRQLKEGDKKKKFSKALPVEDVQTLAITSDSDDVSDEDTKEKNEEVLEEAYASSNGKQVPNYPGPRKSKRSKRKRAV